jgi:hypothetical protein
MKEGFLKLTSSAYKLSEYFPESDPLKPKVKERILIVMEMIFTIDYESNEAVLGALNQQQIIENIDTLLGYFEIAKNQEWISSINYLIISGEYKKVRDKILQVKVGKETIVDTVKKSVSVSQTKTGNIPKRENLQKFSERQKKIVDFLKEKEKAQVMDLQAVLPNITKRTIRRDLDQLLATGDVIRMGEFNQVFYKIS